jgi:predicted GTPase
VYSTSTIDSLSSTLEVNLCASSGEILKRQFFALSMDTFCGDFFRENETADRNILLFGLAGSTKSSFINSCYSLLGHEMQPELAQSGGSETRTTTEFRSYRLVDVGRENPTRYRLWDTWGLESANYKNFEFQKILHGLMDNRTPMPKSRLGNPVASPNNNNSGNDNAKPHCIIFFIPAGELDSTSSDDLLSKTLEYVEMATAAGVSCVVAVTKIDTISEAFRTKPAAKNPEVESKINTAALRFHVGSNRVFPLVNYHLESTKSFEIDRVVWKLLNAATKVADSGAKSRGSMSAKDQRVRSLIDS